MAVSFGRGVAGAVAKLDDEAVGGVAVLHGLHRRSAVDVDPSMGNARGEQGGEEGETGVEAMAEARFQFVRSRQFGSAGKPGARILSSSADMT
jgi:hypothetical protein